jgi:AraC-like DNA-binding protein
MAVIFNLNKTMNPNLSVYYPLRLSTSLIIIWICYYGFFKFSLLTERVQLRQILSAEKAVKVDKADFNDIVFQRMVHHLQTTQNYLQADYSVFQLQSEIYISRRKIADSLNFYTNKSFSDYINKMRIDKAMEILKNPLYVNYTIVSIGLECGFKSKSTFYREFLKQTGTTPTDFRINIL